MGGEYTLLFWGVAVVVRILLPLFLEVYELIPHFIGSAALRQYRPRVSGTATLAVLAGGFVLQYVVVYAGQAAGFVTT